MTHTFIYPEDYFKKGQPDQALRNRVLEPFAVIDTTISMNMSGITSASFKIKGTVEGVAIYAGWMMSPKGYAHMLEVNSHLTWLVSVAEYLQAHHLSEWYPKLAKYTMDTRFPKTEHEQQAIFDEWEDGVFVKGEAKSFGDVSFCSDMEDYYELLGYCDEYGYDYPENEAFRKIIELKNEYRLFSYKGKVYASKGTPQSYYEFAQEISGIMNLPFISIDIALHDNKPILVEIGDGVSDLKGFTLDEYEYIFKLPIPDGVEICWWNE
jgi:hypothetical protein